MKMMDKMNCPHKKSDSKKPAGKCNDCSGCSICPVCSIFVFQSQYSFPVHKDFTEKKYQSLHTGYISPYTADIWKPPNGYLLNT